MTERVKLHTLKISLCQNARWGGVMVSDSGQCGGDAFDERERYTAAIIEAWRHEGTKKVLSG